MKVLVTRPATLSKALCEKIKALGAIVESFPVIDIRPTPHQAYLQQRIEQLHKVDIAIFISQHAVHFTLPAIQSQWTSLPGFLWAAIGTGTAAALKKYGISEVLLPAAPPYGSESLLATKPLQTVNGKQIFIFRGNGGRTLLKEVLEDRGAKVEYVEVYQRLLPEVNLVEKLFNKNYSSIDVIVTTSAECLNNLIQLVGKKNDWLKEVPIIVVGSRMYKLAQQLAFKRPLLATGADDTSIMQVLTKFKENSV